MTNELALLWKGRCDIKEYQETTNPTTHQTTHSPVATVSNEPCRVSFTSEVITDVTTGAAVVGQVITLFIRPDLPIKPGSVIEVTQNGVTTKYKRSSKPSVYSNHQEVKLTLYEENA